MMRFIKRLFGAGDSHMPPDYVAAWRKILIGGASKSWVLFRNGTAVILISPVDDLRAQAVNLMKEWGPVHAGCPAGDFSTVKVTDYPGWVVTCHHNDILTYVDPSEVVNGSSTDITIGLRGRSKRDVDAKELNVIHVEDNRGKAPTTAGRP
jgi:hypothetical protein